MPLCREAVLARRLRRVRNPAIPNNRRLLCRERTPWRSGPSGTPRSAFPTEFGRGSVTQVSTMPRSFTGNFAWKSLALEDLGVSGNGRSVSRLKYWN